MLPEQRTLRAGLADEDQFRSVEYKPGLHSDM